MKHIELIARGVVWNKTGEVLVCRASAGHCYLPGGHVEFGEAAIVALRRELREECGVRARIGALLAVHEFNFRQAGKRKHEITLLFHVEHTKAFDRLRSLERGISFEWIALKKLRKSRFLPIPQLRWLLASEKSSYGIAHLSLTA